MAKEEGTKTTPPYRNSAEIDLLSRWRGDVIGSYRIFGLKKTPCCFPHLWDVNLAGLNIPADLVLPWNHWKIIQLQKQSKFSTGFEGSCSSCSKGDCFEKRIDLLGLATSEWFRWFWRIRGWVVQGTTPKGTCFRVVFWRGLVSHAKNRVNFRFSKLP